MNIVQIITHLGAIYQLPDVSEEALKMVAPKEGELFSASVSSMTLVNKSEVALTIPARIIKKIEYNGRLIWECPV